MTYRARASRRHPKTKIRQKIEEVQLHHLSRGFGISGRRARGMIVRLEQDNFEYWFWLWGVKSGWWRDNYPGPEIVEGEE